MAIIESLQITNVGEDVEKREHLYTVGGNVNWSVIMENSVEVPQKTLKNHHMIQQFHSCVYVQKKTKTLIGKDTRIPMFIAIANPSIHQQTNEYISIYTTMGYYSARKKE